MNGAGYHPSPSSRIAKIGPTLAAVLVTVFVVVSCASREVAPVPARPPNIVFVMTDDQGFWAMGAAGNKEARTPHLDGLAEQGARLENCFVVTPVCSPSRAAFLTARYATEVNILDYISRTPRGFAMGLDPRLPTWPRELKKLGYATALIGKWHLGAADEYHPRHFGYDEFTGFRHGAGVSKDPEVEVEGVRRKVEGYTPDILTDFAADFIVRRREQPFLLSLHFWAPHANTGNFSPDRTWLPLSVADWGAFEDLDPTLPEPNHPRLDVPRVKRMMREYLASVASVDRNVGRLLAVIKDFALTFDTIVVFTSDHGYNMGHHGIYHKGNGRWVLTDERGSRPNLYETSLRVPALVWWPGVIPARRVVKETIMNLDWYPTLLAMAGAGATPVETRGRNFLPLLQGQSLPWSNDVFAQYSMRHATHADLRSYRTARWKLVRDYLRENADEFYDLRNDPGETINRIDSTEPEIREAVARLDALLHQRMLEVNDPLLPAVSG